MKINIICLRLIQLISNKIDQKLPAIALFKQQLQDLCHTLCMFYTPKLIYTDYGMLQTGIAY